VWQIGRGFVASACRGWLSGCCLRPVGFGGSVGLFVCVFVSVALVLTLSRCVSGCQTFEQVFQTSVRESFWLSLSEFPTESDRISPNRILKLFNRTEPNRTESQSSTESLSGLFPRLALHDRWAAASRLVGSPGTMWSACQGSLSLGPSPHR
jgi:hypothetical protein